MTQNSEHYRILIFTGVCRRNIYHAHCSEEPSHKSAKSLKTISAVTHKCLKTYISELRSMQNILDE